MRSILSIAVLAIAVGALAVVPGHAAKRGAKNKAVASVAAAQCSPADMVCCPGPCPIQATTSVAAKPKVKARPARAAVCPVSDPSACPSSCPRDAATAVAVNATQR